MSVTPSFEDNFILLQHDMKMGAGECSDRHAITELYAIDGEQVGGSLQLELADGTLTGFHQLLNRVDREQLGFLFRG